MALATAEGRRQLLETLAHATEQIGDALASLGAAYERLDQIGADRLEEELFGPVQLAYGRAKRTHAGFAARHGIETRSFGPGSPGPASTRAKGLIERAAEAVNHADGNLATLQDSPLPLEVGDVELRAGLADVRKQMDGFGRRSRGFLSTLGR